MSREKLHRKLDQIYRHVRSRIKQRGVWNHSVQLGLAANACDDRDGNAAEIETRRALGLPANRKLTDDEADLMLRGYALGVWHVKHEAESVAIGVQRQRQQKGATTRTAAIQARNAKIVKSYKDKKRQLGDLEARKRLAKQHELTLETVTKVVRAQI